MRKQIATGGLGPYESIGLRKDGTKFPMEIRVREMEYEGRKVRVGAIMDITERKRVEDALRESEERYRTLFEGIPVGLYRITSRGEVREANPALVDIIGYPDRESFKRTNANNHYVDAADRRRWQKLVAQHGTVDNFETRMRRYDGSTIWVLFSGRAVCDAAGDILHYDGSLKDITERKRREAELKRRLMKFKLEEGGLYLVSEDRPNLSLAAFDDLLAIGQRGLAVSRTPEREFRGRLAGDYDFWWLAESGTGALPPDPERLLDRLAGLKGKHAFHFDRLDYLLTKNDPAALLTFVQRLREWTYLADHVAILSVDPATLDKRELRLLEQETRAVRPRLAGHLTPPLRELLRYVFRQNRAGLKPSYLKIGTELHVSKPTVRKRIQQLVGDGYLRETVQGRRKILELTDKATTLFKH